MACTDGGVELYFGGLWSAAVLEVLAEDAARLTAELFAVGFRWTHRPRHLGRGLWHPELHIGIDIVPRACATDSVSCHNSLIAR